jgi:hypothetical protein
VERVGGVFVGDGDRESREVIVEGTWRWDVINVLEFALKPTMKTSKVDFESHHRVCIGRVVILRAGPDAFEGLKRYDQNFGIVIAGVIVRVLLKL